MTGGNDWTAWLDAHGPALVLFARQRVPGRADAEDVVQEAFLRFWRSRQRAVDPAAYLFACVRSAYSCHLFTCSRRPPSALAWRSRLLHSIRQRETRCSSWRKSRPATTGSA